MKLKIENKMKDKISVPSEIIRIFKSKYPQVDLANVSWSWEVPTKIYEAEFEIEGKEYEVEITVTGHHLLTEIEIPVDHLPAHIKEAVSKKYPEHSIDEVERVEYSNGDVSYEIDLVKEGGREFEVHYREDGEFIAKGTDL